jgi:hypothetical protein
MDDSQRRAHVAVGKAMGAIFADRQAAALFDGRGLGEGAVKALVLAGLTFPEQLLFMSIAEIKAIPGIGKSALTTIIEYRSKFGPKQQ